MKVVRPHPNPTDARQVEVMTGLGSPPEHIAHHLGLPLEELQAHYPRELQNGASEANLRVARTLFDMATSGDFPQATIAWLKMRANWSETPATPAEQDENTLAIAKEKLLTLLNRGK